MNNLVEIYIKFIVAILGCIVPIVNLVITHSITDIARAQVEAEEEKEKIEKELAPAKLSEKLQAEIAALIAAGDPEQDANTKASRMIKGVEAEWKKKKDELEKEQAVYRSFESGNYKLVLKLIFILLTVALIFASLFYLVDAQLIDFFKICRHEVCTALETISLTLSIISCGYALYRLQDIVMKAIDLKGKKAKKDAEEEWLKKKQLSR